MSARPKPRSRQLLLVVNLATALACAELTVSKSAVHIEAGRVEPAALPHCPHCGGQRFAGGGDGAPIDLRRHLVAVGCSKLVR
jgi:hypothetical protein